MSKREDLMDVSIANMIAAAKANETEMREVAEVIFGECTDALLGYEHAAALWKNAADDVFQIGMEESLSNDFTARAFALAGLASRTLESMRDMVRSLRSGSITQTMVCWRAFAEAKNSALFIDMNKAGSAGWRWMCHQGIEQAKLNPDDHLWKDYREFLEKRLEERDSEAGAGRMDTWAVSDDHKQYKDAISRSEYVWRCRPLPLSPDVRAAMMKFETDMIKQANSVVHPTLSKALVQISPHVHLVSTLVDSMAVMEAYKIAAGSTRGWPDTDQFSEYPAQQLNLQDLADNVLLMHGHCLIVCHNQTDKLDRLKRILTKTPTPTLEQLKEILHRAN